MRDAGFNGLTNVECRIKEFASLSLFLGHFKIDPPQSAGGGLNIQSKIFNH